MKYKRITIIVALFLGLGRVYAQEAVAATGGDASGSGGTTSYSIGQVVYTTNTGGNGSIAQGVVQAFEIFVVTGIQETHINLELSIFPNPTTDFLTLTVSGVEAPESRLLVFQLYDVNGRLVRDTKPTGSSTTIPMKKLPSAIYFLKVIENQSTIKTFKIIKN